MRDLFSSIHLIHISACVVLRSMEYLYTTWTRSRIIRPMFAVFDVTNEGIPVGKFRWLLGIYVISWLLHTYNATHAVRGEISALCGLIWLREISQHHAMQSIGGCVAF